MKYFVLVLLVASIFFNQFLIAAVPTIEALFRNGNNKELIKKSVSFKFMIEDISNIEKEDRFKTIYIKSIFKKEDENKAPALLQLSFSKESLTKESFESLIFFPNFKIAVSSDLNNIDRSFFYSIISMLVLNDSELISKVIKKIDESFKTNEEIMNVEKVELLGEYKKYLIAIKDDKELKKTLDSPLIPIDIDKKKEVNKLMKESIYQTSENISLIRKNKKFFWQIKLPRVTALFDNRKHRLRYFHLTYDTGEINLECDDYILFDGMHELPHKCFLNITKYDQDLVYFFKIRPIGITIYDGVKKLTQIVKTYQGYKRDNQKREKKARIKNDTLSGETSKVKKNRKHILVF